MLAISGLQGNIGFFKVNPAIVLADSHAADARHRGYYGVLFVLGRLPVLPRCHALVSTPDFQSTNLAGN